ncbi:MAG: GntR family transcriptional regulator [Clostridiales bacterium]|jgi:DNA-binding transcriptional regulator YhcF (GntR family)|nr:GntR family transcriptional regulator [Clostridiales bacterium]
MNDSQPIYTQVMEIVENGIISGVWGEGELIISTTQISRLYNVNPTTAVKAISRLTDDGLLYKRPGIGMCVAEGAREKLLTRRKADFLGGALDGFLAEARTLNISTEHLIKLIKERGIHD